MVLCVSRPRALNRLPVFATAKAANVRPERRSSRGLPIHAIHSQSHRVKCNGGNHPPASPAAIATTAGHPSLTKTKNVRVKSISRSIVLMTRQRRSCVLISGPKTSNPGCKSTTAFLSLPGNPPSFSLSATIKVMPLFCGTTSRHRAAKSFRRWHAPGRPPTTCASIRIPRECRWRATVASSSRDCIRAHRHRDPSQHNRHCGG